MKWTRAGELGTSISGRSLIKKHLSPSWCFGSMSFNDVLVGFDFFKAFSYVFDYPDGLMLISSRKGD